MIEKIKKDYISNRPVFILIFIFIAFFAGSEIQTYQRTNELENSEKETAEREYKNSLLGCERGNNLREYIFTAVSIAAENAVDGNVKYERIINEMKSAPTADPKNGRLDCTDPEVTFKAEIIK
jgi:hypothetical protein